MNAPVRRWFREPMAWLVVGLPLAGVLATIWLIDVAGGDHVTDGAPDPVRRTAQVQQRDLAPDRAALERDLRATLRREGDGVRIAFDGAGVPLGDATVAFVHPADESLDRIVALDADGRADAPDGLDPAVAWRIRLVPASGEWRLVGRWDPADPRAPVALRPALATGAEVAE